MTVVAAAIRRVADASLHATEVDALVQMEDKTCYFAAFRFLVSVALIFPSLVAAPHLQRFSSCISSVPRLVSYDAV